MRRQRKITLPLNKNQLILKEIHDARVSNSREGQIREAKAKGFTLVGISTAGLLGK